MEIIEAYKEKSDSCTMQSHWLQATVSGANEKLKAIVNILELDNDPAMQNTQMCETRKEAIAKIVKDLCTSYCSLAQDYDNLRRTSVYAIHSESCPSNKHESNKHKDVSECSDESQLDVIESVPESTVEDADFEYEGSTNDPDHLQELVHNLTPEDENYLSTDESCIKPGKTWSDGMKFKLTELLEENTQLQVELIRRNSEKRDTITKLQEQVSRLMAQKDSLQRHLSYYERNIHVTSPSRRTIFLDKFFRCSS